MIILNRFDQLVLGQPGAELVGKMDFVQNIWKKAPFKTDSTEADPAQAGEPQPPVDGSAAAAAAAGGDETAPAGPSELSADLPPERHHQSGTRI